MKEKPSHHVKKSLKVDRTQKTDKTDSQIKSTDPAILTIETE